MRCYFAFSAAALNSLGLTVTLLALLVCTPAAQAAPDPVIGRVEAVEGEAVARRDGGRLALTAGAAVMVRDVIETGDDARLRIVFDDGSVLMAGANTSVSIAEYNPHGKQRGFLSLLTGIIRTQLSSLWKSDFRIETRAAIASVRSTDWVTIADPDRSSVLVVGGIVDITATATGEWARLVAGFGIDVPVGEGLPAPRQWPAERVTRTLGRLPPP